MSVNLSSVLAIVHKGLTIATTAWENRDLALQAVAAVKTLASKTHPTVDDLDAVEKTLDALLDEFNA